MGKYSWRVVKEFGVMERQMGRMLRNTTLSRMVQMQSGNDWLPAVDVYETDDEICVYVDTAGIDLDNLTLLVDSRKLTVSGYRQLPIRENVCSIHQLEIEHGCFNRVVSLPKAVDSSAASSKYVNGILEIRMFKIA